MASIERVIKKSELPQGFPENIRDVEFYDAPNLKSKERKKRKRAASLKAQAEFIAEECKFEARMLVHLRKKLRIDRTARQEAFKDAVAAADVFSNATKVAKLDQELVALVDEKLSITFDFKDRDASAPQNFTPQVLYEIMMACQQHELLKNVRPFNRCLVFQPVPTSRSIRLLFHGAFDWQFDFPGDQWRTAMPQDPTFHQTLVYSRHIEITSEPLDENQRHPTRRMAALFVIVLRRLGFHVTVDGLNRNYIRLLLFRGIKRVFSDVCKFARPVRDLVCDYAGFILPDTV